MKNIVARMEKLKPKPDTLRILRGILVGIMLALIFLRLYYTDMSTAPEFIYNQF